MNLPRVWTSEELLSDVAEAKAEFRRERLAERDLYTAFYEKYASEFRRIMPALPELFANRLDPALVTSEFLSNGSGEVLRYLTAPPVSFDDMATLANTPLTRAGLAAESGGSVSVNGILSALLDRKRFPWVTEERDPTDEEVDAAVKASAALLASQRVQTDRRNRAKEQQESAVKLVFASLGYAQAPAKRIRLITDAPAPMSFCGSTLLGKKQGDVYARLPDKRLLAIECKVSNSEVNSFKRVMNDSLGKAHEWRRALGEDQVIPVVVLKGVYKFDNLKAAQRDMFMIWDHRLSDMTEFVSSIT